MSIGDFLKLKSQIESNRPMQWPYSDFLENIDKTIEQTQGYFFPNLLDKKEGL